MERLSRFPIRRISRAVESLTLPTPPMVNRVTGPLLFMLAVTACTADDAELAEGGDEMGLTVGQGSTSLAITSEALYFARGDDLVRFDRSTGEERLVTSSLGPSGTGFPSVLAVNATRLFYRDGIDTRSVPLDGGADRLEARVDGCVGRCLAVTDDSLFVSGGTYNDPEVVSVDLATGESTTLPTPAAVSIAVDDTGLYGASCYDAWSLSHDGAELSTYDYGGLLGCPSEMATDGDGLLFDGGALYRAPVDTLVPEVLLEDTEDRVPFVIRDGVVFAATGSSIVRIDDAGEEELAAATEVQGIAVEGEDLYWIAFGLDESVILEHLKL